MTTLDRKLSVIEQRRREREMELQRVVNDITQRHHSEKMALQRKMDIALQEKDIQIQRFRMEKSIMIGMTALLLGIKYFAKKTIRSIIFRRI